MNDFLSEITKLDNYDSENESYFIKPKLEV